MKLYVIVFATSALILPARSQIPIDVRILLRTYVDKNRDGRISLTEIVNTLTNADINEDGILTFEELSCYLQNLNITFADYLKPLYVQFAPSIEKDVIIDNVRNTVNATIW